MKFRTALRSDQLPCSSFGTIADITLATENADSETKGHNRDGRRGAYGDWRGSLADSQAEMPPASSETFEKPARWSRLAAMEER